MEEVEAWLTPELDRINLDPAFLIRLSAVQEEVYPWDGLEIVADTADLVLTDTAADAETPFLVYGYLRLMDARGALVEAYPGTEGLTGYILERAILERVAEVWLLGRSVFDTQPYAPLDELVYASEFGYLDDFIFATQPDRFPGEEAAHRTENPGREEEFRSWFRNTFGSDGPRFIRAPDEQSGERGRRGVAGPRRRDRHAVRGRSFQVRSTARASSPPSTTRSTRPLARIRALDGVPPKRGKPTTRRSTVLPSGPCASNRAPRS